MIKSIQPRDPSGPSTLERPPSAQQVTQLLQAIVLGMNEAQLRRALLAILADFTARQAILVAISPPKTSPR